MWLLYARGLLSAIWVLRPKRNGSTALLLLWQVACCDDVMMMCRTHMHHAYVSSLVDVCVCATVYYHMSCRTPAACCSSRQYSWLSPARNFHTISFFIASHCMCADAALNPYDDFVVIRAANMYIGTPRFFFTCQLGLRTPPPINTKSKLS